MQVKELINIAKKKEPTLTIDHICEQEDQYLLNMLGEDGSPLVNSSDLVINKKTKECKWVNTISNFKLVNKPILNEYDV